MKQNIIKKDTVVKRLAESLDTILEDAIRNINDRLQKCVEIPVIIPMKDMGISSQIRNELVRLLVNSGWQVKIVEDKEEQCYHIS